jgi:hypothetical protein
MLYYPAGCILQTFYGKFTAYNIVVKNYETELCKCSRCADLVRRCDGDEIERNGTWHADPSEQDHSPHAGTDVERYRLRKDAVSEKAVKK